jgi:putative peptide maturation system protein
MMLCETTRQLLFDLLPSDAAGPQGGTIEERVRRVARETGLDIRLLRDDQVGCGTARDLLVGIPGQGTLSLGFCGEDGVPWPLLGARPWRERDVLRVNEETIEIGDVIGFLDFMWGERRILRGLVDLCIVREHCRRWQVEVSDEELQVAFDALRRSLGLLTKRDTEQWMAEHGLDHERLERYAYDHACVERLRERVAGDSLATYIREHRADLQVLSVARLCFRDRAMAEGARARDVTALARQILDGGDGGGDLVRLDWERIRRRTLAARCGEDLGEGDVSAVFHSRDGWAFVRVMGAAWPSEECAETRSAAREFLFQDWLAERRRAATIEWFWGPADDVAG